jgi:hypothetical protein
MTDPPDKGGTEVRDDRGRFVPGNPGGPGAPLGRLATALRRAALEAVTPAHVAAVVKVITKEALRGNTQAARLLFERLLGRPREEPAEQVAADIEMLPMKTPTDCADATDRLLAALLRGSISENQAQILIDAIKLRVSTIELVELSERLARLEKAAELRTKSVRRP